MHHLVATYLGYKGASGEPVKTVTDAEDFLTELGNVPVRTVAPLDTSAFDAAVKELHHG